MSVLQRYPLCSMICAYVISLAIFMEISILAKIILLSLSLVLALCGFLLGRFGVSGPKRKHCALAAGIFLFVAAALLASLVYVNLYKAPFRAKIENEMSTSVTITDIIYESSFRSCYGARTKPDANAPFAYKVLLECDFATDLSVGDVVSVKGELCDFNREELGFDYASYYSSKGYVAMLVPFDDGLDIIGSSKTLEYYTDRVSSFLSSRLGALLSPKASMLAKAFVLGDKSELDPYVFRDFKYIGAYHTLAVSGMHLSIIAGLFTFLLYRLNLRRSTICAVMIPIVAAYMLLVGTMSVTRAGIMLMMCFLAFLLRRERDAVTSLFVSLFLICLFSPYSVGDVGLLLSFLSTLGILNMGAFLKDRDAHKPKTSRFSYLRRAARYCLYSFAVSLGAMMFSLPAVFIYFGEISVLAPLSTLLLSLPISLLVYFSILILPLGSVPLVFDVLAYLANASASIILWISRSLSGIPGLVFSLRFDFIWVLFAVFIILLLILLLKRRKFFSGVLLSFAVCAVLYFVCFCSVRLFFTDSTVSYINNDKNDAFLISSADQTLLCDISSGAYSSFDTAMWYLSQDNFVNLDSYMLTHYHKLHIKTVSKVASEVYLESIYLPIPRTEDDCYVYGQIAQIAAENGIEIIEYPRDTDTTLAVCGIEINLFREEYLERSAQPLISVEFNVGGRRLLYVGSSVFDARQSHKTAERIKVADAVIFGAHGPKLENKMKYDISGCTAEFIAPNASIFDKLGICIIDGNFDHAGEYKVLAPKTRYSF